MTTLTASSQLTDGCDVPMAHAIDRLIRISTAVAVLAVASVAAYVSYWHAYVGRIRSVLAGEVAVPFCCTSSSDPRRW